MLELQVVGVVVTYVIVLIVITTVHGNDDKAWLRALIVTAVLAIVNLIVEKYGLPGWVISALVGYLIIMRVMNYGFGSAFFFVIVVGLLQYLVMLGLVRYLPQ